MQLKYHMLGKALYDSLRIIVDDAMQDDPLKVNHGQASILPVGMSTTLLIVRLDYPVTLQMLLVALLNQIKELLHQTFQLRSIGRKIDNLNT